MIIRNSLLCLECNTEIESRHRHDYVSCPCGNAFVDGGKDYLRRGIKPDGKFKDTSIIRDSRRT